jgi:hypothetical protein
VSHKTDRPVSYKTDEATASGIYDADSAMYVSHPGRPDFDDRTQR